MALTTLKEQESIDWGRLFHSISQDFEERIVEEKKYRISSLFESGSCLITPQVEEIKPSSLIDEIKRVLEFYHNNFYEIRDETAIIDFLLQRISIVKYLFEAPQKISEYFGDHQGLALEIIRDPEGAYEELFLYIKTNLEPDDALNRLDKLDKEWFLNIPQQEILDFNINFEFI